METKKTFHVPTNTYIGVPDYLVLMFRTVTLVPQNLSDFIPTSVNFLDLPQKYFGMSQPEILDIFPVRS